MVYQPASGATLYRRAFDRNQRQPDQPGSDEGLASRNSASRDPGAYHENPSTQLARKRADGSDPKQTPRADRNGLTQNDRLVAAFPTSMEQLSDEPVTIPGGPRRNQSG